MFLRNRSGILSILAEFKDIKKEQEYLQYDMKNVRKVLKWFIVFFETLNILFLIPDLFVMDINAFHWFVAVEVIYLILVVVFLMKIDQIENPRILYYWITTLEMFACTVYILSWTQYDKPNFLLQAFGVAVVMIAVFMLPNRFINMLLVSIYTLITFIIISMNLYIDLSLYHLLSVILYLAVFFMFGCIMSINLQYMKRMNYLNILNLMKLSMTDYLTQIFNRGKLEDELKLKMEYAKMYHIPLSLILFDFDNFKIINDTFGHLDGDRLIVEVTSIVRDSVRDEDIFARWGGDEFVLLLPGRTKEKGVALAENLRDKIASHKFNLEAEVNCSFGVVELVPEDDSMAFLKRADILLYEAKRQGGNCVKS
jgi:diguanylate cyclase (GGDEF)-like protein